MESGCGTTASDNTSVGRSAGEALTTGASNTFIGNQSGKASTTGGTNVGVGHNSLLANTTGAGNVAVGGLCISTATTASYNTSMGYAALNAVTGSNNTAMGTDAGVATTTGANNLFLGKDSGRTGSPGGNITTASNEVCIGNASISAANIQVDWTIASDKRDKTDVSPLDLGLEFINQLEPVTYRWDKRSKYSDDQSTIPDGTHKEEQLEGGLLAQDVELIENQYGYQQSDKTNLITKLSEDGKMYGIKYSKLVPMLIKAVQELSAEVEELKKEKNNGSN